MLPHPEARSVFVHPNFITFDGADGSGSNTLASAMCLELANRGHPVTFIDRPKVEGQTGISTALNDLETRALPSGYLNRWSNVAYFGINREICQTHVAPLLLANSIVVLITSEVKSLMHTHLDNLDTTIARFIASGTASHGLKPILRVLITAPVSAIRGVLYKRQAEGTLSRHDPRPTNDDISRRLLAFNQAADQIVFETTQGITHLRLFNDRKKQPPQLGRELADTYLSLVASRRPPTQ